MNYHLSELGPEKFQRLLNALLVCLFQEKASLTPIRGADGGLDGIVLEKNGPTDTKLVFQAKFHFTHDARSSELRTRVLYEFAQEIKHNPIAPSDGSQLVLVTNVGASRDALRKQDQLMPPSHDATIWWREHVVALLDQCPQVWATFPELFPGRQIPFLAQLKTNSEAPIPLAVTLAISEQFRRDSKVKFRQIDLARDLVSLFVDLEVSAEGELPEPEELSPLVRSTSIQRDSLRLPHLLEPRIFRKARSYRYTVHRGSAMHDAQSALHTLMDEAPQYRRILLQGGPGQGKSTLTQMLVQIYRATFLDRADLDPEGRWPPQHLERLPVRIELRDYGDYISSNPAASLEEYIAAMLKVDSGGSAIDVETIHTIMVNSRALLVLDGLDEVGSDDLRQSVLNQVFAAIRRFEQLSTDLRVVLTTRPPALAGQRHHFETFTYLKLLKMKPELVSRYVDRWLDAQLAEQDDRDRVRQSFDRRRAERHVEALTRNPMQLSVLLHFIYLRGEAFPDRRAELYRDYFQIVIDRDVEKSESLRQDRETVEALHRFLGFIMHDKTEKEEIEGTLERRHLLRIVRSWLKREGDDADKAQQLFRVGEERLGLIVTLRGEGENASYGFEIQPIREYFAAAFVNHDLRQPDAHLVFQKMLRHPFWREVALFLGGLRRPNERADLISRARQLDSDADHGWRQHGREAVQQLLSEGALAHPPHVYTEGVRFLIEALDYEEIPVQREPEDFIEVLSSLLFATDEAQIVRRISSLLRRSAAWHDTYAVSRLVWVATHILNQRQVVPGVAACIAGGRWEAAVRGLAMLARRPDARNTSESSREAIIWSACSAQEWALAIYNSPAAWPEVYSLDLPHPVHRHLLTLMSANGVALVPWSFACSLFGSSAAAWRLAGFLNIIRTIAIRRPEMHATVRATSIDSSPQTLLPDGLDSDSAKTIFKALKAGVRIVEALLEQDTERLSIGLRSLRRLSNQCGRVGLAGWFLARMLSPLLLLTFRWSSSRPPATKDTTTSGQAFDHLLSYTDPFFRSDVKGYRNLHHRIREDIANYYERPEEPLALSEVLLDCYRNDNAKGLSVPIPAPSFREAFDSDIDSMVVLMKMVGSGEIPFLGEPRPLTAPQLQRLAGELRRADDAELTQGAALLIENSRFINIFGTELVLNILRVGGRADHVYQRWLEHGFTDSGAEDAELIGESISKQVLSSAEEFPFAVRCAAAAHVAQHQRLVNGHISDIVEV